MFSRHFLWNIYTIIKYIRSFVKKKVQKVILQRKILRYILHFGKKIHIFPMRANAPWALIFQWNQKAIKITFWISIYLKQVTFSFSCKLIENTIFYFCKLQRYVIKSNAYPRTSTTILYLIQILRFLIFFPPSYVVTKLTYSHRFLMRKYS